MGAVVKTIELDLMGFLSRAASCYPSQAQDRVTVTVVSEDLMRDSYPYADVLVSTSGLSLNFFPGISSPIDCFLNSVSHMICCMYIVT